MNTVDFVKALLKERHIPLSRIERDLGFANGYIGQLKKGTFPSDRLFMIAEYLGVSPKYLESCGGAIEKTDPAPVLSDELRKKMYEASIRLTKECGYTTVGTIEFLVKNGSF